MFKFVPIIFIFSVQFSGINSDVFLPDLNVNYFQILNNLAEVLDKLPESECVNQFGNLVTSIAKGEQWALRMVDASAKPQSGILMGNILHIGNYDECLGIDANVDRSRIQGKYCSAALSPHPQFGKEVPEWISEPMGSFTHNGSTSIADEARVSYGLCVPKICTIEILQNISNVLEDNAKSPFHFTFLEHLCDGGDPQPYTYGAIFAIVVFSTFAAVMVASTLYDIFIYSKLSEAEKQPNILISFSVLTNGKKLFNVNASNDEIGCLNGLRVISLMWVVFGHDHQYKMLMPHTNSFDFVEKFKYKKENSFALAATLAVDTFFVIGGLLVTFLFMKSRAKGAKFSLPMFYLHRILRLTPALAMAIYLSATLFTHMGSGPFWPVVYNSIQKPCSENWWRPLTYLQNYIRDFESECLPQTWYLAVDTQMYFLTPLVLFPLLRWPKLTLSTLVVIILSVSGYIFAVTWVKHLEITFLDLSEETFNLIYFPTHVRGSIYLVGMICGYFVYKTKTSSPLKLTKFQVMVLWISSLGLMIGICFTHWSIASATEYSALNSALFVALTKVGWSIALSVIILLCVNNYGGPINTFLSHDIFTVLIRLNYSVYLLHLEVMTLFMCQDRVATYASNMFVSYNFWGDYMSSLGVSVIWVLAFESPVIAIEKVVFGKKKGDFKKKENGLKKSENGDECVVQVKE